MKASHLLNNTVLASAAFCLAGIPVAAPAHAQDPQGVERLDDEETANEQEEGARDDIIIVTGSRIPRPKNDSPNPVVSLDAEAFQQAGTTNLTDFLTDYPALALSVNSAASAGTAAPIGGVGLNILGLRALGTSRTLTLVDGRRHVAGVPGSSSVDISTIPADLVERVDILTGGASAVYGADGVTGVVNIILKKEFEGINARAQAGISQHGDAAQRLGAITVGKNFLDGRANVALAYEVAKEDRLGSRDRRYLTGLDAYTFVRNPEDKEVFGGPSDGVPDTIPVQGIRYINTSRAGAIDFNFNLRPDFIGIGVPYDPGIRFGFDRQQGGNTTLVSDYGNGDILPEIERHVVNGLARFEVSDTVELFAEGKYASAKAFTLGTPTFDYDLFIEAANPFIPANVRPLIRPFYNSDNPTRPGVLLTRDHFDFGVRGEDIDRETVRGVVGARGEISPAARYELSYTYGRSTVVTDYVNDIFDDRFYAAIDVVRDPATGQPTCRANIDPNWTPYQPFAFIREVKPRTTFQRGECVPLNLFGEGLNSEAALDFIRASTQDRSKIDQHVVNGVLSGDTRDLLNLPGGPVAFVLGAEYRREKSSFIPDALSAEGLTFSPRLKKEEGRYDVKEVFGEVRLPFFEDAPFAHRLEVSGAARLSDYSSIGRTTTWGIGGSYAPVRDIAFNATYAKAMRAPNIAELFGSPLQTFASPLDPCSVSQLQNGTSFRKANCDTLLRSLGVANPATYERRRPAFGFSSGNPDVKEERATTWTAGVLLQPRFLRGLTVRADWYDIKIRDAINALSADRLAALCVDLPSLDNPYCGEVTRQSGGSTPGVITGFLSRPLNVSSLETAGLDVDVNYGFSAGDLGRFDLKLVGNYMRKFDFVFTSNAPAIDRAGTAGIPKYMANFDLTWRNGPYTLNYGISWYDKTSRFDKVTMRNNPDIVAPEYKFFYERWEHDLYLGFDVDERFQLFGGVNNFLDQKPDIAQHRYPVSAVGRFFFAGAKVKLPGF